jgi:hypothetical protein
MDLAPDDAESTALLLIFEVWVNQFQTDPDKIPGSLNPFEATLVMAFPMQYSPAIVDWVKELRKNSYRHFHGSLDRVFSPLWGNALTESKELRA